MNKTTTTTIYLHALTPVHAGTGQVSASVVDLPIAREKATNYPFLPATSLKGTLKSEPVDGLSKPGHIRLFGSESITKKRFIEIFEGDPNFENDYKRFFGEEPKDKETEKQTTIPGTLQFGDARLLCFPVRSWQGTFAYVTCPLVLSRLQRDFTALGASLPFAGDIPKPDTEEAAMVSANTALADGEDIWLEDLKLKAAPEESVSRIATGIAEALFPNETERNTFVERFVVVSNTLFDFLVETATEITARVKLKDDTKTVTTGGLWYEEAVPAETIFVAPVLGKATFPIPSGTVIQIGGNETVGRGLCRLIITTTGGNE
jgi:CRISPR-associated protein Cmr4